MNSDFNLIGDAYYAIGSWLYASGFMSWFLSLSSKDPATISWEIFINGGWVIFIIVLLYGLYFEVFLDYRAGQFQAKWKFVLLAIDIPKNNEQTPKAVENIFSALAGVFTGSNLIDKYWNAKSIESFSFEIVSIEGHIRFLVRTPVGFRDFIESVIYSQYSEAEINEISDYVEYESDYADPKTGQKLNFNQLSFPNPMYNLWGAEFVLVKPYPYPIRTYPEFEHQQTQTFIDPMANLLELLSRAGKDEQIWIQLVVQPRAPDWGDKAKEILAKLQGKEFKVDESFDFVKLLTSPINGAMGWVGEFLEQLVGLNPIGGGAEEKKEKDQWQMFRLSPGEKGVLERVESKLSKQVFKVKFRMVYLGKKENFSKGKGVTGVTGALQQFNTSDANAFKPGGLTKTSADYFFVDKRIAKKQNRILRWYCKRSSWYGESNQSDKLTLLNPEELATLWHFPVLTKTSQVNKIESKKSAPPTRLPYMQRVGPIKKKIEERPINIEPISPNLPIFEGSISQENENTEERINVDNLVAPIEPAIINSEKKDIKNEESTGSRKAAPPPNLPFA